MAYSNVKTTRAPITSSAYSTSALSTTTNAWAHSDNYIRSWNPSKNNTYQSKLYFRWYSGGSFTNTNTFSIGDGRTEKWGMYYNWRAGTAGVGTVKNTSGQTIAESVCPAGFELPKGQKSGASDPGAGSFCDLLKTYGVISSCVITSGMSIWTLYMYPMSFAAAGLYGWSSGPADLGTRQLYLSSTESFSSQSVDACHLTFLSGSIYPGVSYQAKGHGYSVRYVSS